MLAVRITMKTLEKSKYQIKHLGVKKIGAKQLAPIWKLFKFPRKYYYAFFIAITSFVLVTMFSAVKPYNFITSSALPDLPNLS